MNSKRAYISVQEIDGWLLVSLDGTRVILGWARRAGDEGWSWVGAIDGTWSRGVSREDAIRELLVSRLGEAGAASAKIYERELPASAGV